jgi:hypothetical protein
MPGTEVLARSNQVGWWGAANADANGNFVTAPRMTITFSSRPAFGYRLVGDDKLGEYPVHFIVRVQRAIGNNYVTLEEHEVTNNNQVKYTGVFVNRHINIQRMTLDILEWSEPNAVVKIAEFYSSIVKEYAGDDIFNLSLLEEIEASEGTLPVGNISCNELDLTLQNLDDQFFPANTQADLYTLVKRNRKIEPYIGFRINGVDTYLPKGLYWSGDWTTNEQAAGASTTARDRMELIRKVMYEDDTTYWQSKSLKFIAEEVLDQLKSYMPDFYYVIDAELDNTVVPLAFFKRQSYFDIIKSIAQAGLAYAYMDLPTDAEQAANSLIKDILRIKSFENVYCEACDVTPIEITKDDYINKNQPSKSEELANIINVTKKTFELVEGRPKEVENSDVVYTVQDDPSIKEHGKLSYDYKENDLIQDEIQALKIAQTLLKAYKIPLKDVELQTFGDPSLKLIDAVEVPEYQRGTIDNKGVFIINKIQTEYDGGLRISLSGRKIVDDTPSGDIVIYQDTDDAEIIIQNSDEGIDKIQEVG